MRWDLITPHEAADIMGISRRRLYYLASERGEIPHFRIGLRCLRFDRGEILSLAAKNAKQEALSA